MAPLHVNILLSLLAILHPHMPDNMYVSALSGFSWHHVLCRDLEDMKHVLLTNVIGTFAVTKAFLPLLKQGKQRTIINMSSDAGCLTQNASFIHDNRPSDAGMALSYRASKVALNMGELQDWPMHIGSALIRSCSLLSLRI